MKQVTLNFNDTVEINIKLKQNKITKQNITEDIYNFFKRKYKTYQTITDLETSIKQGYFTIYTKDKEIVVSSFSDLYIKEWVSNKGNITTRYFINK